MVQNTTSFGLYLHLLTTLKSIVAVMYFLLNIHKLRRSVTRRDLVSETINMISCGAPSCGFRYFRSQNLKPGPGTQVIATMYLVPKLGNASNH